MSGGVSLGGGYAPGSARSIDIWWPGFTSVLPTNGGAVGIGIVTLGRQGQNSPTVNNTQSQGLSGVGSSVVAATGTGWNGRGAVRLHPGTGGAGTGAQVTLDAMTINPNVGAAATNGDDSKTDDFACWRCFGVLSFGANNAFGATDETGICWSAHNVGNYGVRQGAAGWGFFQTALDEISFIRRSLPGGGVLSSVVVRKTSDVDLLKWNSYEMRLIGATPGGNARLLALINARLVASFDWVNDGLPTPQASNGTYGFVTTLLGRGPSATATGLSVNRVRFVAGPTEASLI